jgi:hypothetical protein
MSEQENWIVVARDAAGNKSEWVCGKSEYPTPDDARSTVAGAIAEETGSPARVILVRIK